MAIYRTDINRLPLFESVPSVEKKVVEVLNGHRVFHVQNPDSSRSLHSSTFDGASNQYSSRSRITSVVMICRYHSCSERALSLKAQK